MGVIWRNQGVYIVSRITLTQQPGHGQRQRQRQYILVRSRRQHEANVRNGSMQGAKLRYSVLGRGTALLQPINFPLKLRGVKAF